MKKPKKGQFAKKLASQPAKGETQNPRSLSQTRLGLARVWSRCPAARAFTGF